MFETARAGLDLTFEISPGPLLPDSVRAAAYESPYRTPDGESLAYLYRLEDHEVLRFPAVADFRLGPDRVDVYLQETPERDQELAELRLLGPVFSYWLERQGIPTLHASAIATRQGAIAFLSQKEGGKTGLAAAFLQAGFPLLTDDILPIEEAGGTFLARSGYPQMRMWPDEAAHFIDRWEDLPTVHSAVSKRRVPVGNGGFGAFHGEALPLSCLYLPQRGPAGIEGTVEIHDISPRDAVIELVRHSFSPRLVEAVGLQPRRLDLFSRFVMQVPIRRLCYPSGFERLPEVVERVLQEESVLGFDPKPKGDE